MILYEYESKANPIIRGNVAFKKLGIPYNFKKMASVISDFRDLTLANVTSQSHLHKLSHHFDRRLDASELANLATHFKAMDADYTSLIFNLEHRMKSDPQEAHKIKPILDMLHTCAEDMHSRSGDDAYLESCDRTYKVAKELSLQKHKEYLSTVQNDQSVSA